MAEKLIFDVLTRASGADDIKKLGTALDDVGKAADKLDGKSGGGGFFAKFTSGAKTAASNVSSAFDKITTDLEAHGRKGGDGFGSGLVGGFTGVFGKIGQAAVEAGGKAGSGLMSGITGALEGMGPGGAAVGGGIFAVLIAAAPAAGAAIAGGIIAGVAAAGIGGGIVLALQDEGIKAAAAELGAGIKQNLTLAAAGFKPAMQSAFAELDDAFRSSLTNIQTLFANTQGFVGPLADSVGKALGDIVKGMADLSAGAAPVIQALQYGVESVGRVIGEGFSKLEDNGAAAALALKLLFDGLAGGIMAVFEVVDKLSAAFGWMAEKGLLGPQIKESYESFKNTLAGVGTSMDSLRGKTDSATAAVQKQGEALRAQTDPAFALIQAQEQMSTAQKAYNDAVRQHGVNSDQAAAASVGLGKATLGVMDASEKAGTAFNGNLTPSMKDAMRAAGVSEQAIAALEKRTRDAAAANREFDGDYNANLKVNGIGLAVSGLASVKRAVDAIPSVKTVTVTAVGSGLALARAEGGIDKKMAQGGVVSHFVSSPTVLYGERGDEAYIAKDANKARSRVIAEQVVENWLGGKVSWSGGRAASGGSTGASAPPVQASSGGGNDAVLQEMRNMVRAVQSMGVYLDQRLVGSVQGREADLYERAG